MPSISQLRKEEQALHALLFTQAQYKNYIPVKSDSLLRIAEAYYRTSNDSLHKAWTLFYLAQYYRDSDEKEKALSYFQQANIIKMICWIILTLTHALERMMII